MNKKTLIYVGLAFLAYKVLFPKEAAKADCGCNR